MEWGEGRLKVLGRGGGGPSADGERLMGLPMDILIIIVSIPMILFVWT